MAPVTFSLRQVALLIATGLFTTAHGAEVNFYSNPDCTGDIQQRNVWDNTCATGLNPYQSIMITTGSWSGDQVLTIYHDDDGGCLLMGAGIRCLGGEDVGYCHDVRWSRGWDTWIEQGQDTMDSGAGFVYKGTGQVTDVLPGRAISSGPLCGTI